MEQWFIGFGIGALGYLAIHGIERLYQKVKKNQPPPPTYPPRLDMIERKGKVGYMDPAATEIFFEMEGEIRRLNGVIESNKIDTNVIKILKAKYEQAGKERV